MAITSTILMVRPAAFGFNAETAANNFFQTNPNESKEELQQKLQLNRMPFFPTTG